MRPNALVKTHPAADFNDVRAQFLAHVGDFIDKGDAGRQESIRGVLNHLSCAQIGDQDRATQDQV